MALRRRAAQVPLGWLGFTLVSTGCSLTADLDSLTAGEVPSQTTRGSNEDDSARGDAGRGGASGESECRTCATPSSAPNTGTLDRELSDAAPSNTEIQSDEASGDAAAPFDTRPSLASTAPFDAANGDTAGGTSEGAPGQSSASTTSRDATPTSTACDGADSTGCGPSAALIHRYSFTDIETSIMDSVGSAHGSPVGEVAQGDGRMIVLQDGYGELPNDVLEGLTDVTIEIWFTSYRTRSWERVFDFGETENGSGKSYLFFTSQVPAASGTMRFAVRPTGETERVVNTADDTANDVETHIAVIFDDSNDELRIYMNGQLSGSASNDSSLNQITFLHSWLGRSMFSGDPQFEGDYNELRIYDGAVDAARLERSYEAGPDVIVP